MTGGRGSFERIQRRLQLLADTTRSFAEATADHERLIRTVAARMADALDGICALSLVSDDGEWLQPVDYHDAGGGDPAVLAQLAAGASMRLDSPHPLARALHDGTHIVLTNLSREQLHARFATSEARVAAESLQVRHVLFVPLRAHGQPIGGTSIVRYGAGAVPFDADDVHFAVHLADNASLAISNSRLLAAAQRELAARTQTEEVVRRGFLEAAPDAIVIADRHGRIVLVNSEAERLFGYARAELNGQPIELLVPQRFRERHPGHRSSYFAGPRTRPMGMGLELHARRKDGTEFPAEVSLSPIETAEGRLVAAAVRDVTERRRELDERNLRMQETSRLKSEFLANMSHELRTPLNAIIGFSELMHSGKVGPLAPAHFEYLGDILASSRHLLQLINDILDLARIESGKMAFRPEPVDLVQLAGGVRDIVRGLAAAKRLRLDVVVEPEVASVVVDPGGVKQILYNYLSNAIKFTPDEGSIAVRVSPEGAEHFRIEVEDSGIGIAPEGLARLFVEFEQLDAGTGKKYQGTGLGLALSRRVAEAHGGRVEARSEVGKGSVFSAILPRAPRV